MTLTTRLSLAMLSYTTTINGVNMQNVEIEFRPLSLLAKLGYTIALIFLPVIMLTACNPVAPEDTGDTKDTGMIIAPAYHACIEAFPVVPDTIIKGLEKWTLKVAQDGNTSGRNRCTFNNDMEMVECDSKVKGDTLYQIDKWCPATLKARADLGGN